MGPESTNSGNLEEGRRVGRSLPPDWLLELSTDMDLGSCFTEGLNPPQSVPRVSTGFKGEAISQYLIYRAGCSRNSLVERKCEFEL